MRSKVKPVQNYFLYVVCIQETSITDARRNRSTFRESADADGGNGSGGDAINDGNVTKLFSECPQ